MTEFVSAVPIIPARDVEAAASWYRDSVRDRDGNAVTFFEPPEEYDPRGGSGE